MAQLPPKIPPMAQNWPSFPNQKIPTTMPTTFLSAVTTTSQQFQQQNSPPLPTWVDEFLDFSSARRGSHRRSASDSVAFLEECRNSAATAGTHHHGFDRLDDDQLMSMFSDDIGSVSMPPSSSTASMSTPTTPSDQNSDNDGEKPMALDNVVPANQEWQPKNEPGEVEIESACKNEIGDAPPPPPSAAFTGGETIFDPKRVKRILANRQSAQRSRVRKLQYISELERSVSTLQTEVSALSPRVTFLDHQRLLLNVDNSALKQRIAALAQDRIFKDAHHEALKKEIERLRQIYHHQQNLQNMEKSVNSNNTHCLHSSPPPSHPPQSQSFGCTDKDQLLC